MKFKVNNKTKRFLILIISAIILFLISYQDIKLKQSQRINNITNLNITNEKQVSPKSLYLETWQIIKSNYYQSDLNEQNWTKWKKRYYHKIKTQEDAYIAINSMLTSLNDSYSKFMSEEEFSAQNNAINSKLYGIGINIVSIAGKIYIANVIENAPAYNQGIRSGDIILKVNGTDVSGQSIYHVAQLIKGEINANLSLELLRGNERFEKIVKREEIKVKTIDYKKLSDKIGYIRISSFIGLDTSKEFVIALNRLQDTEALILDLRGNSGGLFQNAVVISNLFMKKGTIVNVIARQGKMNTYSATDEGCIYNKPLVVLIDGTSASASEILSSALKDNKRATLIGTKTYGKGLVQKVFALPNKTGMNLTIARYLTPNGNDINQKGVEPDYVVMFNHNDFINNIDSQLSYAKNYLEKEIEKGL
ncbi:MAG: S41 family peptidase [Candidatus Gastranaerophilales bacterium]|nr:S41 family peptidase [Candidatus Gastranaerophilales bacterium]